MKKRESLVNKLDWKNGMKNKWILAVFGIFFIYLIFMCSIDWNKPRSDCKKFVEINSISTKARPFEVQSGTCYRMNVGGSTEMYFQYRSHGGKGIYIDADNFPKGTSSILIQSCENSKFLRGFGSERFPVECYPIESTFRFFNYIKKNDIYYFSITTWADPNNTYGYDLYFEELDEIPE